ncbi:Transcription factor Pcc1 [Cryptosporidium parvum]|nr:Transcription factor Pcc1 [Cryptosporidium parvum]
MNKHVIIIDYKSKELANIVMECIKPDFILSKNTKDSRREIMVDNTELIVEIESSNVQILRKTVNAIYGALILSTKTIEEFSNI